MRTLTLFGLLLACAVALFVMLAMLAGESNPDRVAAKRAAAETQAHQAAAQAAAAQAALERERWAGQAQLEMAQAQATVMRTNAAMPTITLLVAGAMLLLTPASLLLAAWVLMMRRGRDERTAPPPTVALLPNGQVVYLLPPETRAVMRMVDTDHPRVLRIE